MPFTFAHPAIVWPLSKMLRKRFSITALVIGSMSPDFEYFLRMTIKSDYSHSLFGILWFDLPMTVLVAFIFHNIVRDPLVKNMPEPLQSKFSAWLDFDWNKYFKQNVTVILLSSLIGAESHILWDAFTHRTGYFVEMIPALTGLVTVFGKEVPVYKLLQHLSSFVGIFIVGFFVYNLTVRNKGTGRVNLNFWVLAISVMLLLVGIRLVFFLDWREFGSVIATSMSAGVISLIVTALAFKRIS